MEVWDIVIIVEVVNFYFETWQGAYFVLAWGHKQKDQRKNKLVYLCFVKSKPC
jgi:hypothetical protein